jgi:hypothetical protein
LRRSTKEVAYLHNGSQVWLLVVANGLEPSTQCELAPEIECSQFETDFDLAFFIHDFGGFVVELSTKDMN